MPVPTQAALARPREARRGIRRQNHLLNSRPASASSGSGPPRDHFDLLGRRAVSSRLRQIDIRRAAGVRRECEDFRRPQTEEHALPDRPLHGLPGAELDIAGQRLARPHAGQTRRNANAALEEVSGSTVPATIDTGWLARSGSRSRSLAVSGICFSKPPARGGRERRRKKQ